MLPKDKRVRKTSEYKKIFQKGKALFSDVFVFKFVKNEKEQTRFGIIVSTKVSKKAVVRNRLKRQISEVLRTIIPQIEGGYDIAVMVKKDVGHTFSFEELKKQLQRLCKQADLFIKGKKHG